MTHPPKKALRGLDGSCDVVALYELSHPRIVFLESFPLALPHGDHVVAQLPKVVEAFQGGPIDVVHTPIVVAMVRFLPVGNKSGKSVPKAPYEIVDGPSVRVETMYVPKAMTVSSSWRHR